VRIRKPKPSDVDSKEAKTSLASNTLAIAVVTGFATLAAAGFGAYALVASAKLSRIESCTKRIDERELATREKAAALLKNLGGFLASTAMSEDTAVVGIPGTRVVESAFELMAYAPPELNIVAVNIGLTIRQGLAAKTPSQQREAIVAGSHAFDGWTQNYSQHMKSFDAERAACQTN